MLFSALGNAMMGLCLALKKRSSDVGCSVKSNSSLEVLQGTCSIY